MTKLVAKDVATYATRILFEPTIEGLKAMEAHVEGATKELSSEGICSIIAFCCTVGSMIGGVGYDQELIQLMERTSGVPAVTTTTAVKAAIAALGVHRIAMATPYTAEINHMEKDLMEAMGYEVTEIIGYHEHVSPDEFRNEMIGRLEPEDTYRLGLKVNGSRNQAIFISCTNLRAIEIIEPLEQQTGKPVITSNQATMWHALRVLGIQDSIQGYGHLLEAL
ncbi:MAG: aspartate/glutamate racemase family protein [Deltaproteobacteria bacterium]|nr:aspartate/glutamate racemase family protein [Deltaproteobacteria bacterium]